MKAALKQEFLDKLNLINEENYSTSYNDFVSLLYKYRDTGMKKDDANEVILEIGRIPDLNNFQEDILIELSNRMEGHCRIDLCINW